MTYLLLMIEETRLKLQELADQFGMTSEETIECRKQLDTLLVLLEQALQNKSTDERAGTNLYFEE
ncbi:aspartyl-phosphate phosphatase Spo0E family protein [Neobacillus pocheonensis]|uniref:Spo0E family sporulation regulatory protein-aspartic acid phosphatase n=1 Tax=Neobacillus pocheonensis TaxID=363869 RepID=UPI003D2E9186